MISLDKTDLQRLAVSALSAVLLSTATVVAAVSPAKAVEANAPLTIGDWQTVVEQQIDRTLRVPGSAVLRPMTAATVRVRFAADGAFEGASLARSTGVPALDREALRTATKIAYPALPNGLRGRPQTVEMKLFFGSSASDVTAARRLAQAVAQAVTRDGSATQQSAALPTS